ncbi:TPA: hypothetical protein IAA87_07995 [Candidatus Avigastranaerophilus faecigallinarum]|nr:hypothetical protein [Candidatus Avigastranaerophilus faecigallinarum]
MAAKKKQTKKFEYSKNESFENLEAVQQMALNRKGKDDEVSPDISIFLKAEELKGKLCGLYSEKEKTSTNVNIMGKVMIDGKALEIKVGEDCAQEEEND